MPLIDQKRLNNTTTGTPYQSTREEEMACLDSLPPLLRWCVNENATKLASFTVLRRFRQLVVRGVAPMEAARMTAREVHQFEAGEIMVFSGQHFAEHRKKLPHVLAGVTIQRYGEPGPARHRSRNIRIRGHSTLNIEEAA